MGLLDDLRNQAQGRRELDEADAALAAKREAFYREEIQPRLTKAYQFFMELVEHLNYINLDTRVEYPLFPNGASLSLQQGEYAVVIDSSKTLKRIDINFQCSLEKPIEFEMFGRDAILRHVDRLDRYFIKYEHRDRKDTNLELVSSKFVLEGPLPLKIVINADESNGAIQLMLRNFTDPGISRYTVQVKDFDDAFLDRLGQFMLRKTNTLFDSESTMDKDAKEAIRRRLKEEAVLREQEMIEAEERRKAEEAAEKERTAKEQIKRAVNTQTEQLKRAMNSQVARGKESLKGMFDKLKKQVQAPQQTPPAQSTTQAASIPPAKPAQTHQHKTAKTVKSAQINTPATVTPPVTAGSVTQTRVPAVPAKTPQPQIATAKAPKQSTPVSPASVKTAAGPAVAVNSKPANPPLPAAVKTATVKKTQPPKVYNAPPNNPFLKPQSPVEPPVDAAEQAVKTPAEKPKVEATPKNPFLKPQPPVVPPVDAAKQAAKTPVEKPDVVATPDNPSLELEPPVVPSIDAAKQAAKIPVEKPKLEATPDNPSLELEPLVEPPVDAAEQTAKTPVEKPKVVATPDNPSLELEPLVEPSVDAAEQAAGTPAEKPKLEATPVADSSSRPDLTAESLEADLSRIIERDKRNMPQQTTDSSKMTNPILQTSSTKVDAQTATPPASVEHPKPYLKPGELNTSLSDVLPKTSQAVSAKDTVAPESKNSTKNPFLKPDDLDIDLSNNVVPPQNNDSKENS